MKGLFWIAASVVVYTYLGYPVWLWLRCRWSPQPVRRGCDQPTVAVVLVVRNEASVIRRKLENLLALDYPPEKLEIVVVSDGSTDGTEAIVREFADTSRVKVLRKQLSQGKAVGLNDGVEAAKAEVVFFTDSRQEIEPGALRLLIENFSDPAVGGASGELMLGDPSRGESGKGMGLYWRMEKKIREWESASGSVPGATGAIYCARRELVEPLPAGTILDDVLLPMQIVSKGSRVIFDARARAWDSPNLGEVREFSRKVRTLSGNYQLMQLAPWLLASRNPIRFEFISHKLLRLVVPFALLIVFLSSLFLPQPFYRAVLYAQLAFYALSLVSLAGVRLGALSRLADPAYTFVVLNSAAVVAFYNFVTRRKAVWAR